MRKAALAAWLLTFTLATTLFARTPPYAVDPREGVWLGGGEVFVHASPNRWNVFAADAVVNKLVVDERVLWVATEDGVIRFDTGTLRSTRMSMTDGLPSQIVTTVAADDQYVWFGTNKGLVRYRKIDRTMKVYTEAEGLPDKAVNDAIVIGRQVWFATRGGIAVYSPDVDGMRAFTQADGLGSADVLELYLFGDDLWMRTNAGLTRFRTQTRVFTNFSSKELGGKEVRALVQDGDTIWIGTENGLAMFSASSDHIRPFPQASGLDGKSIVGVEVSSDYVYMTTDKGVAQFSKNTNAFRHFSEADGLVRREGATGTLLAGSQMIVLFPDGAETLDVQADLWTERKLDVTQESGKRTKVNVFGTFNGSTPYNFRDKGFSAERYATAQGGFGFGQQMDKGRQLNGSAWMDYGQVESSGIRDLQYKAEYFGNDRDVVREVNVEDKLKYRYLEEGIERPLLLQGARTRLSTPDPKSKGEVQVHAGFRRGTVARDFLTGPRQDLYQLSNKYIAPGTERVYVDGELLTSGSDYTIIYPAGQLAFLNPERIDDLSVISVEYEYDLMPKKELGNLSILDMLPADNEVGGWVRSGAAQLVPDEQGLFNQIDGAAPKYLDQGWMRAVYATYRQGSRSIQVAIHDMGSAENAEAMFTYEPGTYEPTDPNRTDSQINTGLTTAYSSKSWTDRFYIEVSIDEKSDASKSSLRLFTLEVLDRKAKAGAGVGDPFREFLIAERLSGKPSDELEIGARAVRSEQRDTELGRGRSLVTGVLDERFQRQVGQKGLFTSYAELAGSHRQDIHRDGWAGTTFARFSHPSLDGSITGRYHQADFTSFGSDATRFGTLRDETVINATAYPVAWMPATVFFTRQSSYLPDRPGTGNLQHALARLQVNHEKYPSVSVQVGNTILESLGFYKTERVQIVGQTEYDLARVVPVIKRFNVRALYSVSEAETDRRRVWAFVDRVKLARIEGRLSPTSTESVYALFRNRIVDRQGEKDGPYDRLLLHWELGSGAQSSIVPGLLPQANYNITYDDTKLGAGGAAGAAAPVGAPAAAITPASLTPASATAPPGPGDVAPSPSTREAKTTVSGTLGIYPGEWWKPASPIVVAPSVAVTNDEKATDVTKTGRQRDYRFDNRAVWASSGTFDIELYQRHQYTVVGEGEDKHRSAEQTELRNRFVYRPIATSPITLRLNYLNNRGLNAPEAVVLGAPLWSDQANYTGILEWLMRWNKRITTRPRATLGLGTTTDSAQKDRATGLFTIMTYDQYQVGGEIELRLYPLDDASRLYLFQRDGVFRLFGNDLGSIEAVQFYVGAGTIWRMDDNVYLDTEWTYKQTKCLATGCTPAKLLEPRLLLTINL